MISIHSTWKLAVFSLGCRNQRVEFFKKHCGRFRAIILPTKASFQKVQMCLWYSMFSQFILPVGLYAPGGILVKQLQPYHA